MPVLHRLSLGVLALLCLAAVALGVLAWRERGRVVGPAPAGAVLVSAPPAQAPAAAG